MHALIIEDDYLISRAIQDMLGDLGFTDFSFARSEDAAILEGTGAERFDLVTADARLTPGDGVKAAEAIRAKTGTPLVFVTAYTHELEGRLEGALAGVPVVRKPLDPAELAAGVRRARARP